METTNIILCGLGGQGILFVTKILSQAAIDSGKNVICAETHGMAQRGGSVVSHLIVGNSNSSLICPGTANYVIAFTKNECYRNLLFPASGAHVLVNTEEPCFPDPKVKDYFVRNHIKWSHFGADEAARKANAPFAANLALTGFFAGCTRQLFPPELLKETISRVSPEKFRSMNERAFESGFARGIDSNE